MIFKWKDGSQHVVDAESAAAEIERIREEKSGFYKPIDLVDASRPSTAVLHPEFEWNDAIAAEGYRVVQARNIVRCVISAKDPNQEEPDPEFVRVYVSVKTNDGPQYTSVECALSSEEMRDQILKQAKADMLSFQRKYFQIFDMAKMIEEFEAAIKKAHEE